MYRAAGCSSDESDSDGFESGHGYNYNHNHNRNESKSHREEDPKIRLRDAARESRPQDVLGLLQNGLVGADSAIEGDWTPLMYAASASLPEIVALLLKSGADPNLGVGSVFPLACVCSASTPNKICNAACVKLLLDAKADPNAPDSHGQTPLMKAAKFDNILAVRLLLPLADVHAEDARGRSAIFFAVEHDRVEILKLLIESGARLDSVDKRRIPLAAVAKQRSNKTILHLLRDLFEEENDPPSSIPYCPPAEDWQQLFPLIANKNEPPYSNDVSHVLYGMYCERLVPHLKSRKIGLHELLSLADGDIDNLNIDYPYLKKRLSFGIRRFHVHGWKTESVSIKKESFDLVSCSVSIGSHLKHLIIVDASICYLIKMIQKTYTPTEELRNYIDDLSIELGSIKEQLKKIKYLILQINKRKIPPGDFISHTSIQKSLLPDTNSIFLILISSLCLFAIVKFR